MFKILKIKNIYIPSLPPFVLQSIISSTFSGSPWNRNNRYRGIAIQSSQAVNEKKHCKRDCLLMFSMLLA